MAASISDLDAAIAAQKSDLVNLAGAVDKIHNDVSVLLSKIQAGAQVDLTAELANIQGNTAAVSSALGALQALDTQTGVAPTPATVPPPTSNPSTPAQTAGQPGTATTVPVSSTTAPVSAPVTNVSDAATPTNQFGTVPPASPSVGP